MQKKISKVGEFGLIAMLNRGIKCSNSVIKGIGDDAAVIKYNDNKFLLVTTDMLCEGVHFEKGIKGYNIGRKALACSVSDIAAMGGLPKYAVISVGMSKNTDLKIVKEIYKGLKLVSRKFYIDLIGGDTVRSEKLIINVALIGEVERKYLVTRKGAKKGDKIFVTGKLGRAYVSGWHYKFSPRILESQYLVKNFKPTSMIDISDGLVSDLTHILEASKVSAILYEKNIPRRNNATLKEALNDGEDFELLFTVSPKFFKRIAYEEKRNFTFYEIGEITDKKRGLYLQDIKGKKKALKENGYKHF